MSKLGRWAVAVLAADVLLLSGCANPRPTPGVATEIRPREDRMAGSQPRVARAAFERLKSLEGRWKGTVRSPDGETAEVVSDFTVSAEGSAVVEHGIVGDPMETTTVYYLDRGVLRVTHYCAAGNQPRMYLDSAATPDRLTFSFEGITNLEDPDAFHMRLREIQVRGSSTLSVRWEGIQEGRVLPAGAISMRRVSGDDEPGGG